MSVTKLTPLLVFLTLSPMGILGQGFSYFFRPDGVSHGFNIGDPSPPRPNRFALNPTLRFNEPPTAQPVPVQSGPNFEVQRIPLQQHHRFEENEALVRPSSTQQSFYFNGQPTEPQQQPLYQPFRTQNTFPSQEPPQPLNFKSNQFYQLGPHGNGFSLALGFDGENHAPQQNIVQNFGFRPVTGPFPGFSEQNDIEPPKLILNTTATKASEGSIFTSNFFPTGSFQAHQNLKKENPVNSNSVAEKGTTSTSEPTSAPVTATTPEFSTQSEDPNPGSLQSYYKFSSPVGLYGNRDVYNLYTTTPQTATPPQQPYQYSINFGNPTITSNGVTHHLGNGFFESSFPTVNTAPQVTFRSQPVSSTTPENLGTSAALISTTSAPDVAKKPFESGKRVVITKNGRRLVRVNRKRRLRKRPQSSQEVRAVKQPIATTVTTITSISSDPTDRVTTYRSKFRFNPKPTTSVSTSTSVESPDQESKSSPTNKPLTNRRAQTLQRIIRFRKKQRAQDEDQ